MDRYLVQHYLERTAEKYPEAVAVVDGKRSIRYGVLDALSNKVANQLLQLGFVQGATAGVYLPKSIEAIIAFHAILKVGGAYIPLDTLFSPADRIRHILDISETDWLLTNKSGWLTLGTGGGEAFRKSRSCMNVALFDGLIDYDDLATSTMVPLTSNDSAVEGTGYRLFDVDFGGGIDVGAPKTPHNMTENDLAYILYTSGSTGVPKGVMITHRNAMVFVNWAVSVFDPEPGTIFANHAPFHFDLSVFDLYVSFATAGSVHLVAPAVMNNPRALVDWIHDHTIAFWYSVPSVWIAIVNYAQIDPLKLKSLRAILFAGEVFPPKFLKMLMESLPGRLYYNLYGPTETNVCTYHQVKNIDEIGDEPVPIGKACANCDITVFDEKMHEVAIGETGELYVSGPGVAAGYYRNPEKTAESFKYVSSWSGGEKKMYATGDMARRMAPETYQYVGRKDFMVKCAGFRIELQEIEKAFDRHAMVSEVAVVPCYREERGGIALHAYIALKPKAQVMISELKKHCSQILPQYMVPETIHVLDKLPRNINGKIDRQFLQNLLPDQKKTKGGK